MTQCPFYGLQEKDFMAGTILFSFLSIWTQEVKPLGLSKEDQMIGVEHSKQPLPGPM